MANKVNNKRMLSLFISDIDYGGAAIACQRIFSELNQLTNNQCGWVAASSGQQTGAINAEGRPTLLRLIAHELKRRLIKDERRWTYVSRAFNEANLSVFVARYQPQVIHLHNIHQMATFGLLEAFPREPPIFIYLHDMWYLTGYCCLSMGCDKFSSGCRGVCPQWGNWGFPNQDADKEWRQRERFYQENAHRITVIAPSHWMAECAKARFNGLLKVAHIPNPVDNSLFKPVGDKRVIRDLLGFDADKPLILWGAFSMKDKCKGAQYLGEAMEGLQRRLGASFTVAAFGASTKNDLIPGVVGIGTVRDPRLLNLYYNAATCFVLPSLSESFGLVYAEAMAAGTPCVAFDTTACGELVREGETGYLAELANVESLVNALERALKAGDNNPFSKKCREFIGEKCDVHKVGKQHLDLIMSVISD